MKMRALSGAVISAVLLISPTWVSALADKPMLIVQITADQLRGDLLERYPMDWRASRTAVTGFDGAKLVMV
jgi:hypothetical protein